MHLPVDGYFLTIRGKNFNNTFGAGIRTDKNGKPKEHQGWDIAAFVGAPIYAIADGKIRFIDDRDKFDMNKTYAGKKSARALSLLFLAGANACVNTQHA